MSKSPWVLREESRNVHIFDINLTTTKPEQWFLLQSDSHWDNPKCDRDKMKRHLDEALKRNAPVLDFGDFFCAMQGKYDRRSSKKDIRPEHNNNKYLDSLVDTAADYLKPYKDIIAVRGVGNHESAIHKNHETDLTERLVERMRAYGGIAKRGGYSGYIRFNMVCNNRQNGSILLWYFHGSGGGGPVTKGIIQTNRQSVYVSDADIIATGHVHESWQIAIEKIRLNIADKIVLKRQTHVKIPGYKEEYCDGFGGWHVETGKPPKPTGAWWLRLWLPPRKGSLYMPCEYELCEAK